jgi:hypothetical protein
MIQLKSAEHDFDVEKVGASRTSSQRSYLPVTREFTANKMRVANRGVDAFSKLVPCANVKIVADKITALARHVPVKTRIRPRTCVAIEKVIKAVRAARQPIPAVTAIDTQVFAWLKLQLYFGRLDILENDVVVGRPGPSKTKEAFKAVVHVVIGIAVPRSVAIEGADTRFPAVFEGIARLKRIAMGFVSIRTISSNLIDQVEVVVQTGATYLPIAAQARGVNLAIDLPGGFAAILYQTHVIWLERNDVRPLAPVRDRAVKPLVFNALV